LTRLFSEAFQDKDIERMKQLKEKRKQAKQDIFHFLNNAK